ncbi:hypothetical protein HDU83_009330 [Entophlyctis luteolus]|nr:hypothetical protein HDU83_009330 [Entophlyctis luteolus]
MLGGLQARTSALALPDGVAPLPSPAAFSIAAVESAHKTMDDWLAEEADVRAAIQSIEYYGYISSGLKTLYDLALGGNAEARDYLDPFRSQMPVLKNYKAAHAFGIHFQALDDHVSAMNWFRRAATEANYHESQVNYAAYLVSGKALPNPDPGLAIAQLMKAWANGKNKDAALALGEAYAKGVGVPYRDVQKSVAWYKRAWEQGRFADAAYVVGFSYGTGVLPFSAAINLRDEDSSKTWNSSGLINMDINEALAARMGKQKNDSTMAGQAQTMGSSLPNQNNSANSSEISSEEKPTHVETKAEVPKFINPVQSDYALAAQWYQKAANRGHPRACNNLAELYMTGKGVDANDSLGFKYFKKASDAGLPEGHYNLGRCYFSARGCWENKKKAEELFRKAEVKGAFCLPWDIEY